MESVRIYPEELRFPNRSGIYKIIKDGQEMYEITETSIKPQKKALMLRFTSRTEHNHIRSSYHTIVIPYIIRWFTPDPSSTNIAEVIAEVGCNTYVYIGKNITFFWTKSLIEVHHSGFVADNKYVYGFDSKVISIDRKHIEKLIGKSLAAELTYENIMQISNELQANGDFESVKQEVVHDKNSSKYIPFNVNHFKDIITHAQHNDGSRCAIMGGRRKLTYKSTVRRKKNKTQKRGVKR
jgi:hypothetical protein